MKLLHLAFLLSLCLIELASPRTAAASPVVIEAGQTHTLPEDLVLDGEDVLEIQGKPEKPCTLVGNRHCIRSGPKWTGSLKITHCTIRDLGNLPQRMSDGLISGPGAAALDLRVTGKGGLTIEHCTFDACS